MAYTVQQAKIHLSRLLKEAEEGQDVVIARGKKPAVRLVPVEEPVRKKRIPGQYAGQFQYSDDIFKPLETDEELREYGFDIMVDDKPEDTEKPDERVA
jgi:prevent-host-death family protein